MWQAAQGCPVWRAKLGTAWAGGALSANTKKLAIASASPNPMPPGPRRPRFVSFRISTAPTLSAVLWKRAAASSNGAARCGPQPLATHNLHQPFGEILPLTDLQLEGAMNTLQPLQSLPSFGLSW